MNTLKQPGVSIAIFVVSMAVHSLVVNYRMMEIHKGVYYRIGRWALILAMLAGEIVPVIGVFSNSGVSLKLA